VLTRWSALVTLRSPEWRNHTGGVTRSGEQMGQLGDYQ
jgi:hypothetical protein